MLSPAGSPWPVRGSAALCGLFFVAILMILYSPNNVSISPISRPFDGPQVSCSEVVIPNSPRRRIFTSKSHPPNPAFQTTLQLTLTDDLSSWGTMEVTWKQKMTFLDYIEQVRGQNINPSNISFGLLTSSEKAFEKYTSDLIGLSESMPWSSVEIIYLPDLQMGSRGWNYTRGTRNDVRKEKQSLRRRYLARLRNYLCSATLKPHFQHIIWLDSDLYKLPEGLFNRFLEIGNLPADSDITPIVKHGLRKELDGKRKAPPPGLVTVRSSNFLYPDYDRSSWAGFGKRPSNWELSEMTKNKRKYAGMEHWAKALSQLVVGTLDSDLVKLDSVGGSTLYIRADLVREGLIFPPYLVVGAEWGKDGTEGLESEGLCFLAERMGWGCYALGGNWHTTHTDF
ncbi:hypothetical protein ABW20_dc0109208 [Dactylellina cionopaga]|nr:hypothetical protein ABW20_dc0109208 [Dactylellina cionopaga]